MAENGSSSGRSFLAAFAALAALHVVAVSSSRLLPFIDLPNHLAAATIVRHYGEFGNEFSRYFRVDLFPRPNVLHIVFCSLKIFPSVEAANRAWYIIYLLLLPFSTALLVRRLGGAAWVSALSLLMLYSYSVCWGFAGYTMAIPLILLSAWASAGAAMEPGWRRCAASVLILLLLFFAHALAALFAILVHVVFSLAAPRARPARRAANLLAVLPASAMLATWWLHGRPFWIGPGTAEHLASYYSGEFFTTFPGRWKILVLDNYNLFGGAAGGAVAAAFSLVIIAAALIPPVAGRSGTFPPRAGRKPAGTRYAILLLAVSLACYALLPRDLPGQAILAQRFSVLVLLSLVVLAGVLWKDRAPRFVPTVVTLVCAAHLALWWSDFRAFNRENEGFRPDFLPDAWKGRILAGLIYDYRWRGMPAYIHFPGYYITWKKGIATTSLIGYRFGAVRRKASLAVLPAYLEWTGKTGRYDGRYSNLDYILMRGALPPGREYEIEGFSPLRSAGKWHLLKKD